ncbi:ATP-binding protein [Streptosporangium sp. NPDC000563]|uniref:sensor histidine kinase n=1 Tax=Streptosporangium sp. NPDC000563 TaxID=3154366 RepID=UPI00331E5A97
MTSTASHTVPAPASSPGPSAFTAPTRVLATSMAAVSVAGIVAGVLLTGGMSVPFTEWLFLVACAALPSVGLLIALRRPDNPYGWLLLAAACCLGLGLLGVGMLTTYGDGSGPLAVAAALLTSALPVFYGLSWVFIPMIFPDGRLPSSRWRPVAWIAAVAIFLHWLGILLSPDEVYAPLAYGNPLGLEGMAGLLAALVGGFGQLAAFLVSLSVLVSLVLRARRGPRAERRLLRWMALGVAAGLSGSVLTVILGQVGRVGQGSHALSWLGVVTAMAALPVVITTAVFRHNLLDIRVGIRGSRLFLIFDLRPTVDELLTELGPGLEEVEPVEQLGRLAEAVRAGLETRWAAVTLADGTRVVAGREDGEAVLTVPAGLGNIACGPKVVGRLNAEDRRLLGSLAVPIGLAIQSAGLAARLVNAQEAERRRIERNIHDGAQQQLVALIAGLELARATGGGPDSLTLLREQARQTLADLRELAAGIHPSVLSQGGLAEAVEERCSRLPVATTVTVDPALRSRRFPDEIEGAVYFTVSEAIANALKHAGASRIEARLAWSGGRLRVAVSDDGRGFERDGSGHGGLGALADRMAALGGGLDVSSTPGEGTLVSAWVPVPD